MIRKSFPASFKAIDEAKGIVEAIVNCTAIDDLQKDNMNPGCWEDAIRSMKAGETGFPSIFWGHDLTIPTGKVIDADELRPGDSRLKSLKAPKGAGGVRIVGQYNLETQRGREAFSDVKFGAVNQWSVGFMTADGGEHYDHKGIRQITKVGMWFDVSNVVVGASPGTYTAIAKSAEEVMTDSELSVSDKALAIEQMCLQAIEDEKESDALLIALSALEALSTTTKEVAVEEPEPEPEPSNPEPEPEEDPEAILPVWFLNRVKESFLSPQPSDPDHSDIEIPLTNFARQNARRH